MFFGHFKIQTFREILKRTLLCLRCIFKMWFMSLLMCHIIYRTVNIRKWWMNAINPSDAIWKLIEFGAKFASFMRLQCTINTKIASVPKPIFAFYKRLTSLLNGFKKISFDTSLKTDFPIIIRKPSGDELIWWKFLDFRFKIELPLKWRGQSFERIILCNASTSSIIIRFQQTSFEFGLFCFRSFIK